MHFEARRYDTGQPIRLEITEGRIAMVASASERAGLPYVAPGLIDIQVNGFGGQEFSSLELTPEKVLEIVARHDPFGVARLCPTLTTQSDAVLSHGMRQIAAAAETSREAQHRIAGIHLEGPYIATEDGPRGAHPLEHCCPPDWEQFQRLQDSAGGKIKLVTLSPEYDNAPDFIARATASGVVVSIGHTGANGQQIQAAVDAGARLSTHLGNGAHGTLRRHPNYLWDQMAEDRLSASLIADGHHLPAEVIQTIVRAKTPRRCILVSDESGLAGMPVGRYESSGGPIEILPDGRLVIAGQRQLLAGASLPLGVGITTAMRAAGVSLEVAVDMATRHPAQLLGLEVGSLRPGDVADLVVFDLPEDHEPGLKIHRTIVAGRITFEAA